MCLLKRENAKTVSVVLGGTTGCNYVSLKLAHVFSKFKGCPDIMPKFFWEFGMTDFLLKENTVLKFSIASQFQK